ncbi:MAG: TIGR03557 family F420-dependent LLM class oxidoreductase [Thermomicrobiales bacterium]
MVQIGYTISSEEFRPSVLAEQARLAEDAGFTFASISDHFHPWLDSQGESPFVWSVLGAISQTTSQLLIGTGVTCPIIRTHPAIVAQAVATVADMLPGRFYFGVGTGEYLNEHITGAHWPPISVRQEMLTEALEVIRQLWKGEYTTQHGKFYTVENARIYTLPEELPSIYVAASGVESASLAASIGDGLISTSPEKETVDTYKGDGGGGPVIGQLTVCWGRDKQTQIELAREIWGYTALPGQYSQELALPLYYEQGLALVTNEKVAESIVCGPDIEAIHAGIQEFVDNGFSHVYLHQIGPDQAEFMSMARRDILPRYQ